MFPNVLEQTSARLGIRKTGCNGGRNFRVEVLDNDMRTCRKNTLGFGTSWRLAMRACSPSEAFVDHRLRANVEPSAGDILKILRKFNLLESK